MVVVSNHGAEQFIHRPRLPIGKVRSHPPWCAPDGVGTVERITGSAVREDLLNTMCVGADLRAVPSGRREQAYAFSGRFVTCGGRTMGVYPWPRQGGRSAW
jgi:hypothetical protein